jgi:hypothetical protein
MVSPNNLTNKTFHQGRTPAVRSTDRPERLVAQCTGTPDRTGNRQPHRGGAEYALRDANRPIGISKYELTSALSHEWKSSLPSVEDIERELSQDS